MTQDSLPDLDTSGLCLVKTLSTALTCWPYRNTALRDGARTSTRTSSVAKGRTASIPCRPAPPRQTEALSSRTSRSRPWKRRIELPQQLLLLTTLGSDLIRVAGKPRRRLGEVELRVRGGGAVIAGGDDPNGWATDLTAAKDVQRRAQRVGHVDEHENRAERTVGAVEVEFPERSRRRVGRETFNDRYWSAS